MQDSKTLFFTSKFPQRRVKILRNVSTISARAIKSFVSPAVVCGPG
jgi:hypothetical protein